MLFRSSGPGGEVGRLGADVVRGEWMGSGGGVTCRALIGRSEVARGDGHVRRGRNCPAARGGRRLGFGLREKFGGDHIFIGRGG